MPVSQSISRIVIRCLYLICVWVLLLGLGTGESMGGDLPKIMFVFDASGSMWGDIGGQTKIEAAREVMAKVVPGLPDEVKLGLTAYGHRRKSDCSDIEVVIPMGSDGKAGLLNGVNSLSPKGKTPIADAVKRVADKLKTSEGETTIVLISDGEETCHDDPCSVIKTLKASGIKFILHVVGFGVNTIQKNQLACLADAGGGSYFGAANAAGLLEALETVKKELVQKVAKAKSTKKKAISRLGKLKITMPESARICLANLHLKRVKDGKVIKSIKEPLAESVHPLLAGSYEIIAGFANSNYKPDSEVSFGLVEIIGGEIETFSMGAMVITISDALAAMPAGAVIITRADDPDFILTTPFEGNDYFFYKPKPLPPGSYDFSVHYKRSYLYNTKQTPVNLADDIKITAGKQSVVTLDSGLVINKSEASGMTAWDLVPSGEDTALMRIDNAFNGNFPLWEAYGIPPGSYDIRVYLEGMDEPLPAGEGVVINPGELLMFDTGL